MPQPSELQNNYTNMITYLNSEFQLSRTNCSRVIEKGRGSTFEVCHALLSCRTIIQLWLPTSIPNFSFLGPTGPELLKKGVAALLKYATPFWVAELLIKFNLLPKSWISSCYVKRPCVKVDLAATTQHNTTQQQQQQRLSWEAALLPEWQRSLKISQDMCSN